MLSRGNFLTWLIVVLLLPFVVAISADSKTHPVHGAWIFQSDSAQEYTLTFYPDATFHLLITEGPFLVALSFSNTGEDYEAEEDSGDWEDFLVEADVNSNGVLDEEDFEAARERGDEDLPPSWDDVLQELGDVNGDGVIDQGEYERAFEEYGSGGDMEMEAEFAELEAELMTDAFGETMVTTTSIYGTWEAQDGDVTLTRVEEVYEFNRLSLEEFYTLLLDVWFALMVLRSEILDEEAVSEEEYFLSILSDLWWDREGNPVDVEEPGSLEELKALVVDQMTSMFLFLVDKPVEFGMETETFGFSLDRDGRTLTHSDRKTLVFTRSDASSAIKEFSWGQIKELHR